MTRSTAAFLVAMLGLGPAACARADGKPNALDKAPSRFARLDDMRVHYKSLGEGDTALVFVHGWTCDLTFWRPQVAAFDRKLRMVVIDLPGHGQSDKPETNYTMELFARAVNAVLRDAGVASAILAGHSMGTPVVRQFYRLYPKKTRALVAIDGSLRAYHGDPGEMERFIAGLSGPDFKEKLPKFLDDMFTEKTPPEVRKSVREVMERAPQHVAVSAIKAMNDPAIWKDDKINVPLQVIIAKSPYWTRDYEAYVRKLAPEVDYRVMEGVGHFLMLEKPDAFNDILGSFLTKHGILTP